MLLTRLQALFRFYLFSTNVLFFGGGGQAFYFKKMINFQYPNSYTIGFPFSQLAPKETTPAGKVHA